MIVISFVLRFCNTVCTYNHANKACCSCILGETWRLLTLEGIERLMEGMVVLITKRVLIVGLILAYPLNFSFIYL